MNVFKPIAIALAVVATAWLVYYALAIAAVMSGVAPAVAAQLSVVFALFAAGLVLKKSLRGNGQ